MRILIALTALATTSTALAHDIVNPDQVRYVKITRNDDWVSFENCSRLRTNDCRQIGKRAHYRISDLEAQRKREYWQVAGSAAADVGIVIMGAVATFFSAGGASTLALSAIAAPAGGAMAAGSAAAISNALNPAEQYRQAAILRPDVLNDHDIVVNAPMKEIISRLELVLNKI